MDLSSLPAILLMPDLLVQGVRANRQTADSVLSTPGGMLRIKPSPWRQLANS